MRLRRLVSLVVVVLPLAGCGGAGTDASATLGPASVAGPTTEATTAAVRGRLKLDVPIAGATVTAVDSASGRALSSPATTDVGGFFKVEVPVEGAFTLLATAKNAQGVAEVYARCYDGLPDSRYLHINALTTVGARYRQLHPALNAQTAETRVKQALGVPASLDAGLGAHAHAVANFSHGAFLHDARAHAGGETAYVDALAAGIDAAPAQGKGRAKGLSGVATNSSSGSYQNLSDASSGFYQSIHSLESAESSGVFTDSTISTFLTSSSAFTDTSSSVSSSTFSSVSTISSAASSAGAETAEHVAGSVVGTVLHDLANDVASAVIGIALQTLFSAIFPSDPNQEVLTAIQNISSQVTQLQDSVEQLSAFIGTAFQTTDFHNNAETLRSAFSTIDTSWLGPDRNGNGYAAALNQAAGPNPSPGASPNTTDLQNAVNSLTQILPGGTSYQTIPTLANAQTQIAGAQLGTSPGIPPLMAQFRDLVSPLVNGGGRYRYAANLNINQMYGQWSQLAAYQMKAAQVIACLYRAGNGSGPDFASAAATLKSTADQLQQQRTQLPFPMPDDRLIYDTMSGLVLYGEVFPPVAIGDNLNFTGNLGNWPFLLFQEGVAPYPNSDAGFPWPAQFTAPLAFSAADLTSNTWALPTAGMLWTFLDPEGSTYSGAQYSAQPKAPDGPYLNVLQQYGFTPHSLNPWTFNSINLLYNYSSAGNYWLNNPYYSRFGPEQLPFSHIITTGYNSPWNALSLLTGQVLPNIDSYHSPYGSTYQGQTDTYSEQTADNKTIAPYVLMAVATPSNVSLHPDLALFPSLLPLSGLANVPVGQNGQAGGLHSSTNRAFFGCGRQQAAALAFSGTQLVALAAENPQPQPGAQGLFGLSGLPATSLSDFIAKYYGDVSAGAYVEGPAGIDNDIDTSFGQQLINTCWDLTPYLYWTSSNPQIADVSNVPGQIGQIIRKGGAPGGVVTFTGTRLELNRAGSVGNTVTVTCQSTFAALPPATVTDLFVTPRYQTVHVNSSQPQTRLFAVGQFSDGTSQVLPTAGVTWSSSDPAVVVAVDGSVSVTRAPAQQIVTITAQQGAVSSTVELTVLNP